MEKYSFLMSVYNKEKPIHLKLSIDSMLHQTVKPDEIVIVKDGPLTSELDEAIDYYASNSDLFTIISLDKNGGLGNALNVGLRKARNNLVARMDSDDICLPDRCEKQLKAFTKISQLVICGGQINEFDDQTNKIVSSRFVPCDYESILKFARRRSPFNHPTVMYKRDVVLRFGGYPSSGRKEDLDLFLFLLFNKCYAVNLDSVLLLYRVNEDNLLRRKSWNNCKEYIEIIKKYKRMGFCSLSDYLVVFIGQLAMFLSPRWLTKRINRKYLRKKGVIDEKPK